MIYRMWIVYPAIQDFTSLHGNPFRNTASHLHGYFRLLLDIELAIKYVNI